MKTIFVVNAHAGNGKKTNSLLAEIETTIANLGVDAQIYQTKAVGDATEFVKNCCQKGETLRFIACGGDGTLSEVLNGASEYPQTQIGVIPIGTGNDFCRNFDCTVDFSNIVLQLEGKTQKCDAIRYSTKINGTVKEGYCTNMINIGFDCNVADMTANMKKRPFVSGSMAYFMSILVALIKKKGANLNISLDDEPAYSGKLLLTSIANGAFCGGGIKSNPLANVNDGIMNINIIKNVRRMQFIPLLPHYMDGTILNVKNIDRYLTNRNCKKIKITPLDGNMRICIDGEIIDAGETTFEVVHNAFNFVIPAKEDYLVKKEGSIQR